DGIRSAAGLRGRAPCTDDPHLAAPEDHRALEQLISHGFGRSRARALWAKYRTTAEATATIHQLRHVHTSELVNAGVSLKTIHPRLGHTNAQTVQRYAEQKDATADAEIRSWRRGAITGLSDR
ncbi:MAG: tyrosine-type recombinase/integrase, partial [Pseudonocardiaceae bacterium]